MSCFMSLPFQPDRVEPKPAGYLRLWNDLNRSRVAEEQSFCKVFDGLSAPVITSDKPVTSAIGRRHATQTSICTARMPKTRQELRP